MVTKTQTGKRKELLVGLCALAVILAVLLAVAFSLPEIPEPQTMSLPTTDPPPTTTEPPQPTEPTLPPPESNPYGPFDFQYAGRYLTCLAGESVMGLDVSEHQEEIDWLKVREAGMEFVMIRVGYRGYGQGTLELDAMAQTYYEGAKAAGLKIGAYFFSQAVDVGEARQEARFLLEAISDWELDMPVVYDWEYISEEARTANMDARTLTDCTIAFCEEVKAAGFDPMIYFNWTQEENLMYIEELKDYPFWLAMYSDRMNYPYKLTMWQYTCTGNVPGIGTDVDINLWFTYE